jgi:TonB-linked SusC/RagA family outer membrane protein
VLAAAVPVVRALGRALPLLGALAGLGLCPGIPAVVAAPLTAQEPARGSIAGTVVESESGRPIAGASVALAASGAGAGAATVTDAAGRFRIEGVAAGPARLDVEQLGYEPLAVDVRVEAGRTVLLALELVPRALALDRIVVTATGEQRARQVAHDVAVIDAPRALEAAPMTTITDLILARAPGVQILPSSGAVGAGARIRVRGAGSINLPNDPVVYLDGIRIDSDPASGSIDVGGQVPSRLHDLNPDEIASIEIVRGPSAATLYGTDAAHGVIRVTTKRGRAGAGEWTAWAETGWIEDRNDYPANWFGHTAEGRECFAFQVAIRSCVQAGQERSNPLRAPISTPFRTGSRRQVGASLGGGGERLDYFLSAEWESEGGVFRLPDFDREALRERMGSTFDDLPASQFEPDALERVSLRANFGGQVAERATLRLSAGLISSDVRLPQNDNNILGVIPSGLLGWPNDGPATRYGYRFYVPSEIYAQAVSQEVERLIASTRLDLEPRTWLSARAIAGVDLLTRTDVQHVPRGRVFFGAVLPKGVRDVNTARVRTATVDVSLTARRALAPGVAGRATAGTQYVHSYFTRTDAHGEDLAAGSGSLGGAAVTRASETTSESKTLGVFVETEAAYRDHLFVTGALRADDNSAFGADFDLILYPKVGISWVVSDAGVLPDWDLLERLSHLRLRAAWGQSGAQPHPTDALETYDPRAVVVDGRDLLGVTHGSLGNPDLRPERSSELELGLDAAFLDERVTVAFTHYRNWTRDLLVRQALPPSAGAGESRFVNLGEARNVGFETSVVATVLETPALAWDVSASGSHNRNELVDLGTLPDGRPTPVIEQGIQWFVEGYPLGGYWERPIGWEDLDGDGVLHPNEVAVGAEEAYHGSALPTRELALATTLTLLGGRLRLSARLDHRGGHKLRNLTEVLRCQYTVCRGYNDPDAPLREQARALTQTIFPIGSRTEAGFIEDASFWKLRELGLTAVAPPGWARRVGARELTMSLAGRNLATWTGYTGLDPELNQFGQASFLSRDLLTQPPTRTLSVRLQARF